MIKKYYYYFLYVICYIFFYLHNNKEKIISVVDPITVYYTNDYIFVIIGCIIATTYLLHKYKNTRLLKKNWNHVLGGFFFLSTLGLLVYNFLSFRFIFKWVYSLEFCFFNIFGLLGMLIPLLYLNQLMLIVGLGVLVGSALFLKYIVNISVKYLGYWNAVSLKQWVILFSLLVLYIVMTVLQDMLKHRYIMDHISEKIKKHNFTETQINHHSNEISSSEEHRYNKINHLNEESINEIYQKPEHSIEEQEKNLSDQLLQILKVFSIKGEIYKVLPSYTVTNYFFKPQAGTKMSRIESIEEEISMELGRNIRVTNSLQGVIFEISNEFVKAFSFSNIWNPNSNCQLPLFLGFDSMGDKVILDLTKQPHILMCGTTGSGKSSTLHCLIHSLMTTMDPTYLKFIFIDPKILELSVYKTSPHLFVDIVTDLDKAIEVLEKLTKEMEERYKKMSHANQRSIKEYNKKMKKSEDILPYLVCVIEEFADLALYKNNNFKGSVQRIAQMGRAAGLHLIIATQRPSANVIDGVIKANFPARVALKVANKLESRIILDRSGAERMERPGEMLLLDVSGIVRRVIAPYISEEEIQKLMNFCSN